MRVRTLIVCMLLAAAPLAAQEAESPQTENTTDAAAAPATSTAKSPAATSPAPRDAPASPQRFEPSEKVRADFDVSFPVDI